MSRGFVKEEDQEEAPFIPPRAALPLGVTNYVTPKGHEELAREREELEAARRHLDIASDKERRHATAVIDGKLRLLNERIASARILKPKDQPADEVRFGATVKFRFLSGNRKNSEQEFTIVGVDEADIKQQKIAFLAPLAKALTGKKVGEKAEVMMAGKLQQLEILSINYS
ncbi:transcription elongation factor GreB [Salinimicrobium catena]|uniref:Transcription elongation factor GreB n=1 Tax=Salinimicrobium catena TaxID=390640 RepID=A0A1H5LVD3_9FLAO|nr:GreA/GreB family elongation factor [Salinimicrobium catena]SDL14338.1 transcription elongation factor GreB [Salinimicrobium catena]SEE80447.1 transcription elongation factor GreB [Salinimicrobium catena]